MCRNSLSFVEWKEEFVSQERGSRVVHYILKDSVGESTLAVVGTERSLRHMVYVVADEFVSVYGAENSIQSGFKWRSRREVIDWLTSMLSKQQRQDITKYESSQALGSSELLFTGSSTQQMHEADKMVDHPKVSKQPCADILWLGAAWTCGKQLKHYPAFCRNGITIPIQSFVFIMAKEGSRYLAYLEDMYEDKKGQKKVKVRWFHHSQEVKCVIGLRNSHPKEVFITPHTQVISAECVDGPAIVLNREHFEKCMVGLSGALSTKLHLCIRQYRKNRIKPFDLSKLRGYFDQPVLSCLESNTFIEPDPIQNGLTGDEVKANAGENVLRVTKRTRNFGEEQSFLTEHSGAGQHRKTIVCDPLFLSIKYDLSGRRLLTFKNVEDKHLNNCIFKVDEKIELLSQDSGIRGCWFRCTVLEISHKKMKVRYDDVEDQETGGNLEEWVPAFRLATPDKLGMRWHGRLTIRPCPPPASLPESYVVGAPVDSWWSGGWWEGVVARLSNDADNSLQVYIPGENLFLNVSRKNLRVSRDWTGVQWVEIEAKRDMLSAIPINPETNLYRASTEVKDQKSDDFDTLEQEIPHGSEVDRVQNKENDLIVSFDDHPQNMKLSSDPNDKGGVDGSDANETGENENNDDSGIDKNDGYDDNHSECKLDVQDFENDVRKNEAIELMELER
ncbi:hypothetical protein Ancab_025005 [Ancistrocladus abbreviatus]